MKFTNHLRIPFATQLHFRPHFISRVHAKKRQDTNSGDDGGELSFGLDDLDPVRLGRKSRQAFDDLWTQFATLVSPTKSFDSELLQQSVLEIDENATSTRVLVIGATGRTGRIVLRKLLLRGYNVRAIVRNKSLASQIIPARVEIVVGDIRDSQFCQMAMEGVDKVVFAATSNSTDPEDYHAVFCEGLKNVLHAFMDCKWVKSGNKRLSKYLLVDFKEGQILDEWNAFSIGALHSFQGDQMPKVSLIQGVKQWTSGQNSFIIKKNAKNGNLHFKGAANDVGAMAEVGGPIRTKAVQKKEGIVLRLRGDGNIYSIICTMDDGQRFGARLATKWGYITYRIPFTLFRPEVEGNNTLDGSRMTHISVRYENRGKIPNPTEGPSNRLGRFNIELDWIKTLPAGKETEFVLITCAGVQREGIDLDTLQEILLAKRLGESMLRNSGVSYTVVRPTTLVDEPGGLKSLVFDQGDRLTEAISTVDVADVCVRSLPQPLARNKTFEVAHENPINGTGENEAFELIAHVPDKSTNYLGAALANLQKNT
eukprot:g7459.t1